MLTEADYKQMDLMIDRLLDAYKEGKVTKEKAASGLLHVMAALDQGNTVEAVNWFKQPGITLFK